MPKTHTHTQMKQIREEAGSVYLNAIWTIVNALRLPGVALVVFAVVESTYSCEIIFEKGLRKIFSMAFVLKKNSSPRDHGKESSHKIVHIWFESNYSQTKPYTRVEACLKCLCPREKLDAHEFLHQRNICNGILLYHIEFKRMSLSLNEILRQYFQD